LIHAPQYTIHFVGGPSDGLVLSDPHFSAQDKLQMAAGPAFVQCGQGHCYELVGDWSTSYLLTSARHTLENGQRITCLRYEFSGYELLEMHAERAGSRHAGPCWFTNLGNWFTQIPGRLAKWMLAPIEHPLQVATQEIIFSQRGSKP
jgi:hypothetical protein